MKSPTQKTLELKPIKESTADFDKVEAKIKALFRQAIYLPLIRELGLKRKTLKNSIDDLLEAIHDGEIFFARGQFRGSFNSGSSKELRELGAVWDRKDSAWKIPLANLPVEVKAAIQSSKFRFKQKLDKIDKQLAQVAPEKLAEQLKVSNLFDRTLWKTESEFQKSVKGLAIAPELSPVQRKRIADEWEKNMQLFITDFTQKEIAELRKNIKDAAFSGNRYQSAIKAVQDSYGVTANKAKFLAKQETSLLMTKFKQTRYEGAGVKEYRWGCVAGTAAHPVRPMHKALQDKVFRWDDPPIVDAKGNRKNPGQDYNCRCFARPIVRF